jgi:hypothetical protein
MGVLQIILSEGIETTEEPFPIRVTTPAMTIADCFKFRNKIGLDPPSVIDQNKNKGQLMSYPVH